MNIGIALDVCGALSATGGNEIEVIVIWDEIDEDRRYCIECQVFEYTGDPGDLTPLFDCPPFDLRPYQGRCHAFQYRIEEAVDPDDLTEGFDLIEAEEALCPSDLVREVAAIDRPSAKIAVEEWMAAYDQRLTRGEDA